MTTQELIIPILALSAIYLMVGIMMIDIGILPESRDTRTNSWRIIIWPVVLLIMLSHKIGPFCIWFIKELREAPKAIARALRLIDEEPSSKKDPFII